MLQHYTKLMENSVDCRLNRQSIYDPRAVERQKCNSTTEVLHCYNNNKEMCIFKVTQRDESLYHNEFMHMCAFLKCKLYTEY